jgi:Zn finger protein HypA/HybF involved in hydrogenase expression
MPEDLKKKVSVDSLMMRCGDCREEILQKNPQKCPYCGSTNLISKKDDAPNILAEIEKLKKEGKYEEAALRYEELEMWDKAKECRNANMGKVSTINMECPHCGASQPISSKNNAVTCKQCGKKYGIPKKVLELL